MSGHRHWHDTLAIYLQEQGCSPELVSALKADLAIARRAREMKGRLFAVGDATDGDRVLKAILGDDA